MFCLGMESVSEDIAWVNLLSRFTCETRSNLFSWMPCFFSNSSALKAKPSINLALRG